MNKETKVLTPLNGPTSPKGGGLFLPFLMLLCVAIFFVGLGRYPLYDPDEGRNAEVAREMVEEGHWLPPTLNGEIRYQKPPLYYWLVASSFEAFGKGEFPARLPSALAAMLCVFATVLLGRRILGLQRGLWAGVILSTSLIFAVYSHIVIFDMVLTLLILVTIALFYLGLIGERPWYFRLSALFAALAFLTKGPIGVLIPAMALVPVMIYRGAKGEPMRIPWLSMSLIFVVVALPTYLVAEMRAPGYCYHFFWEENVLRYLTPRFHREGPIFYYLWVILAGLFPWTWMLKDLPSTVREMRGEKMEVLLLFSSWILLPTLFFTLSHSKLPHYILPTFPGWALILADGLPEMITVQASRRILTTLGAAGVLYAGGLLFITHPVAIYHSAAPVLQRASLKPEVPLVTFKAKRYSLAFYTGRRLLAVENKGVMERTIKKMESLYLFTKNKERRVKYIETLARQAGKKVEVLGKSPRYLLLLVGGSDSSEAISHYDLQKDPPKNKT